MGIELLNTYSFSDSLAQTQKYLAELGCPWDLVEELERSIDSKVDEPEYSQTICTAVQVALVDTLRQWGINPSATVGHSSGEIGAAYTANIISHRDAIKIAYFRGICSQEVPQLLPAGRKGAMLAAGLSEAEALPYLEKVEAGTAVVACVNSPYSVTLSGDSESIDKLNQLISDDGKFSRKLRVRTAYHSPHMRLVAQKYLELMGDITAKKIDNDSTNRTKFFSSVTGAQMDTSELGAAYWVRNMCEQVKFSSALTSILSFSVSAVAGRRKTPVNWSAVIEVGPHGTLQGPVGQILKASSAKVASDLQYASMLTRLQDGEVTTLKVAGFLWSLGHEVDFMKLNHAKDDLENLTTLSDLPAYPWNHAKGFWHETPATRSIRFPSAPRNDFLGLPAENQNVMEPKWTNRLRISENPWIRDHMITGTVLYPAAGMLTMVLEAAQQMAIAGRILKGVVYHNVHFERGLVISDGDVAVETSLVVHPHASLPDEYTFTVYSVPPGGSWTKHCFGDFSISYEIASSQFDSASVETLEWQQHTKRYQDIKSHSDVTIDTAKLYEDLENAGMEYGETFRNMTSVAAVKGTHSCYGTVQIPDTKSIMPYEFEYPHVIHPATLDAIFHLLFVAFADGTAMAESAVPYTLEYMYIAAKLPQGAGNDYIGYAQRTRDVGRETAGDIIVSDSEWSKAKIVIRNFAMRQVSDSGDSGMRTASEDGAPRRVVGVQWHEDVDFLNTDMILSRHKSREHLSKSSELQSWIQKLCHKHAGLRSLFIVDEKEESLRNLANIIYSYGPNSGAARRFRSSDIATTSDEARSKLHGLDLANEEDAKKQAIVLDLSAEAEAPFAPQSLDIVVALLEASDNTTDFVASIVSKTRPVASQNAHFIFSIKSAEPSPERVAECEVLLRAAYLEPVVALLDPVGASILVIARGVPQAVHTPTDVFLLEAANPSETANKFKESIATVLSNQAIRVHKASLADVEQLCGQHVISLLEVEKPFVNIWTSEQFQQFKDLIKSAKHMLWITRGGQTLNPQDVEFSPTTGLLRVIRNEYPRITLPHLDLSTGADLTTDAAAKLLADVWISGFSTGDGQQEMEFAEFGGSLFIPRVIEEPSLDKELEVHSGQARPIMGRFSEDRPMKLDANKIFIEDTEASLGLEPFEVEILVESVSLNACDLEDVGGTGMSTNLGREAVGIIKRIGSSVDKFHTGQRVVVMREGCFKTHLRQHQNFVVEASASLPVTTSVAIPRAFCTAWYALVEVARLVKGSSVLILNAGGGVGQAAIQIAKFIGAEIFATVGTQTKRELLVSHYGVPEDHVFDSHATDFGKGIIQKTNGRGVDVVLSSRPGKAVAESCLCLADFGHFIDLSKNLDGSQLASQLFKRNCFFAALDIDRVTSTRPELMQTIFYKVFDLASEGSIGNISPIQSFSVSAADDAFASIVSNKHSGKVVITFDRDATVLMLPPSAPELELDPAGTYILAGGLGALGVGIAKIMYKHGARHIVFLTRSGASKTEKELQEFIDMGLKADAIKCDITSASDVSNAIQDLIQRGCQIKGLIQAAMVLEDGIFETMPFSQWNRTFQPKAAGTLNLHNALPKNMNFFIMLSSIVAIIGNAGQANYCAGNTYQDAFAKYRRNQGLAATTINVGIVSDSAHFIAENDISSYIEKYGHLASLLTTRSELEIALRAVMQGKTADGGEVPAQIVLGLSANISRDGAMADSWTKDRKFDHRITVDASSNSASAEIDTKTCLKQATSFQEALKVVETFLKGQVALDIGAAVNDVDIEKPLYDYGVDSLRAVVLRNKTFRDVGAEISVFEILSPTPIAILALRLVHRSDAVTSEIVKQAAAELS